MNVITKIDKTVEKYNMLSVGDTVVAGVSGGKDSMLLLHYLLKKSSELKLKLIVANVEHGIRGESSKSDTRFVKSYCEENGIELRCLEIDAPIEAKKESMGVEEYSRKRRYDFFDSIPCDKIATAHSLSDNVETLIFRLARGTSLSGAKGIPAVRGKIIRPLIECSSDEIVNACNELRIPYVTDETNLDNSYSRNMIRNEILPLLNLINPKSEAAINRFIYSVNEDDSFISTEAEKYVSEKLSVATLRELHPALTKRVIERYASHYSLTLDEKHLKEVYSLLFKSGKTQIKNTLFAVSNKDFLYFTDLSEKSVSFNPNIKKISLSDFKENKTVLLKEFAFFCDCDKINGDIVLRQRCEGDLITLEKRNCSKSLKKLFNELKIPIEERCRIPVICDETGVIGVYGYAVSDRVAVDKETSKVMLLSVKTEDKD